MRRFLASLVGSALLSRFGRDERANVAMIFGIAAIPLFGLAGAAIDYSSAARMRSQMQNAVDSAALAGARKLSGSDAQVNAEVRAFLDSNLPANLRGMPYNMQITNERQTIILEITGRMQTAMLPIVGVNYFDIRVGSESTYGNDKLEVALVLDNTGSMAGAKITTLRTAVAEFLTTMQRSADGRPDAVKVSIVPFDTAVNMGTSFRNQPWVNFSGFPGGPAAWNGCVTDRDQPNDTTDATPNVVQSATHFRATSCSLEPVTPLTSDWSRLQTAASRMRASGYTNVTIGVVHGLHTLSPNQPYTEAQPFGTARLRKVMIVLTDGDNTQNRWTWDSTQIDARTTAACNSVKNAGVLVYTVRVMNGNQALLRSCASSPANCYNITSVDQLRPVFQQLASQLTALRLTR